MKKRVSRGSSGVRSGESAELNPSKKKKEKPPKLEFRKGGRLGVAAESVSRERGGGTMIW